MTKKQQQIIGGGVALCLLLLVAGFFLLVKPKKSQITTIKAQTASEQSSNATLRSQIAMLQQQQAGLVGKQVDLQQVAQRIPDNAAIPSLLRQLTQIHTDAGVDIVSITPGTPSAATTTSTVTTPTTTTSSAAGTTSATTSTTAVHPGVSSAASYQTIPITLSVLGDYSHMVIFLNKLEQLKRLYLVKSLTLAPGSKSATAAAATGTTTTTTSSDPDGAPQVGDQLSATVTGEVYETSPDTTAIDLPALNGATTGSSAAPTPTPTASAH